MKRKADCSLYLEHSCNPEQVAEIKASFIQAKRNLISGPLDPSLNHSTGGVGASTRNANTLFELEPKSLAFKRSRALGRSMHVAFGQAPRLAKIRAMVFCRRSPPSCNRSLVTDTILVCIWREGGSTSSIRKSARSSDLRLQPHMFRFVRGTVLIDKQREIEIGGGKV